MNKLKNQGILSFYYRFFAIMLILAFATLPSFADDKDDYWLECKKCVDGQNEIIRLINKFDIDNKVSININSEEDYNSFLEKALKLNYINKASIGAEGKCSYRYNSDTKELYCVKHGALDYVKNYDYYKYKYDRVKHQKKIEFYLSIFAIILLLYAIFFEK